MSIVISLVSKRCAVFAEVVKEIIHKGVGGGGGEGSVNTPIEELTY